MCCKFNVYTRFKNINLKYQHWFTFIKGKIIAINESAICIQIFPSFNHLYFELIMIEHLFYKLIIFKFQLHFHMCARLIIINYSIT